jgi:hypothetical protein
MFCERCLAITDDTPAPSTFTLNLVGTGLFGWGTPCRDCRSVGKVLWICFGVPVIPLARYRVIHTGWGRYVGRRRISDRRRQRLAAAGYVPIPPPYPPVGLPGAADHYADTLADLEQRLPADHPSVLELRFRLAQEREAIGDRWDALAWYETVALQAVHRLGPQHLVTRSAERGAVRIVQSFGSSRVLAKEFDSLTPDRIPGEPPDRVAARAIRFQGVLARVKLRAHRPGQALWFLDRGIRAALVEHGPRHPDTAVLVSTLRVVPKAARLRRRRLEREVEEYLQSAGL